jgi:tetratricopeptide (TPR) repeat protein
MRLAAATLFTIICAVHSAGASEVVWLHSYQEAVKQAKETSKPIFVDCFADWCLWCHQLEAEVYKDAGFIELMKSYIPLRIDVEDGAEGTRLARTYHIAALPTLLVLDSSGEVTNRIGGFLKAADLIHEIRTIQGLLDKERTDPNDWTAIQELGEEYLFRDMNAEAEVRFQRILQASTSDPFKESALSSLALAQYYQEKRKESLATVQSYLKTYPNGKSAEDVLLLLSQIQIEMDQLQQARQTLEQFLEKYPNSDNLKRVREVLQRLN